MSAKFRIENQWILSSPEEFSPSDLRGWCGKYMGESLYLTTNHWNRSRTWQALYSSSHRLKQYRKVPLVLSLPMLGPVELLTVSISFHCNTVNAHAAVVFFLILVCEAIGTAATLGLLCQPRVIGKMSVEKQMECRLAGETEVLGENLPQHHFCPSQNTTWPDPDLNPSRRGWKPATNRLSYGAACCSFCFGVP
jgi:hypothetical protein